MDLLCLHSNHEAIIIHCTYLSDGLCPLILSTLLSAPEFVEVFLIPKTFEGDKGYAQQMLFNGLSSHALISGTN